MANYFNTLPLRAQLAELGKCRFMHLDEFSDGVEALRGKKMVVIGCGAQGLNQGLNLRDSGLDVSYALRDEAIAQQRQSWKNATENGFTVGTDEELLPTADVVLPLAPAQQRPNVYLWGGTTEPDMDCSGLMQMAFASQDIWIPRDAYQQERFCQPVAALPDDHSLLRPGDLLFFGTRRRCTHVGIHLGEGRYRHSSGQDHGRNGIGIDSLHSSDQHPVACHYRAEFRGAGRVVRCHDGSHLS